MSSFKKFITYLIILCSFNIFANDQKFEVSPYSQTVYGGIGLIQVPTARFSEDGEFLFGLSTEEPYNRLYSKVQIFPWVEAVVRYTEGTFRLYIEGSDQTWKDKGIDFKFKLFDESKYLPQLALGVTDFGGTGAFSSECLVASKRFQNIDFSLGLGWGRLGGVDHANNIFGIFDENSRLSIVHYHQTSFLYSS